LGVKKAIDNMGAPSVAKPSGQPDFKEPKVKVGPQSPGTKVPKSGTNDFEAGGGKKQVGSAGGDASDATDAYKHERQAQETGDSYF
jgi:hypothetical protein